MASLANSSDSESNSFQRITAAFLSLPAVPFDGCRRESTIANSLSLARFDDNDYSVPVRYAHHPVLAKGSRRVDGSRGSGCVLCDSLWECGPCR